MLLYNMNGILTACYTVKLSVCTPVLVWTCEEMRLLNVAVIIIIIYTFNGV